MKFGPYPWSELPPPILRSLMSPGAGDISPTIDKWIAIIRERYGNMESSPKLTKNIYAELGALHQWFKTDKRLIKISKLSAETLSSLSPRWRDLPRPGDALYDHGIIFHHCILSAVDSFAFAAPLGDLICPRISICVWLKVHIKTPEGVVFLWEPVDTPRIIDEDWLFQAFEDSKNLREVIQSDSSEEEKDASTELTLSALLIAIVVNALAAMNDEQTDPVVIQTKKQKRQSRNAQSGVRGVNILRLDPDGLSVWKRRVTRRDGEARRRGQDKQPRATPSLYTVEDHIGIRWVLQPRKGEEILGTKPNKKNTHMLYAVKRAVSGWTAGRGLKPKMSNIRTEDEI